jgi:hypothetical protein
VSTSSATLFGTRSDDRINVSVRLWDAAGKRVVKDTPFSIKPSSPLKNILRIYSVREAVFPSCLGYFRFSFGSRELSGEESPLDLSLSDGDFIDAVPSLDDLVGSRFV